VRSSLSGTLPARLGGACFGEPRDGAGPPLLAAHNAWQSACHYNTELRLRLPRLSGTLPSVGVGTLDLRGCSRLSGTLPSWARRAASSSSADAAATASALMTPAVMSATAAAVSSLMVAMLRKIAVGRRGWAEGGGLWRSWRQRTCSWSRVGPVTNGDKCDARVHATKTVGVSAMFLQCES